MDHDHSGAFQSSNSSRILRSRQTSTAHNGTSMAPVVLIAYHLYCSRLVKEFAADRNQRSRVFYRWFNDLPVLILTAVVILVVVKPF
jgi:hypothetical protein